VSKALRIICTIVIIVICVCALQFVLTIDTVDSWLSEKLVSDTQIPTGLVYTEHYNESYGVHEEDKPCICFYKDRLYMVVKDTPIDITPDNINISYFGKIIDFNETISHKKNCLVSEDGKYIVYVLYFKDFPYLYYLDVEQKQAYLIAEKVDSFDIVENDSSEALTVVYATGYDQHNEFFTFTSDITQNENGESVIGGASKLICENINTAGVFEAYGKVVYLNEDKELFEYDFSSQEKTSVSSNVEKVYFPQEDFYNYDKYYQDFTVCASKNGKDYILNGTNEVEIKQGYYDVIPKYTVKGNSGNLYYYSEHNKQLIELSGAGERILYSELGKIYGILGYYAADENGGGHFVAASEDSLYLLKDDGSKAQKLWELSSSYKKNSVMIEKHLRVYKISDEVFYINHLAAGSLILNENNPQSWLSAGESYNYGITAVKKTADGFESKELNIPSTRKMSVPTEVATEGEPTKSRDNLLYVSYFDDGSVKAVSLLSKKGSLVKSDVLASAAYAKGQCDIEVFPCETGTYFLRTFGEDSKDFLYLPPDETVFQVVVDEKGVYTENYDEFSVAVSFGKLVIF